MKAKILLVLSLYLLFSKPVSTFSQGRTTTVLERNEYDHAGRLLRVFHSINGAPETQIAEYQYNELGQQVAKNLHKKPDATFAQTLSQRYNERGWLTSLTANLFQMQLDYVQSSIPSYSPQWNGNISAITWTHLSEPGKAYRFSYDRLSRLTNAESFSLPTPSTYTLDNTIREGNISYDANGNILTLLRNQAGIAADNLSYRYEGNRLRSVVDASTDNTENYFKDNGQPLTNNDYTYDECGRLTTDANKGITSVTYNNNSLPIRIEKSAAQFYQMTYDEAGTLRRKVVTNGAVVNTTDYVAGFQYENGVLDFIPQPEGFVKSNPDGSFTYRYAIRDHLGSTRVVVNQDGTLSQKNDYYPFGQEIYRVTGGAQWNYKYNGKETQMALGLGWVNYGARYYDPALGRWWVVDPMANKMMSFSSYIYSLDNPIRFIDFNGLYPIEIITRSYAPFATFGPGNSWYGNDRGPTLDRNASYKSSVTIKHDTETRTTSAIGGQSRSHTIDGSKDKISRTIVEDDNSRGNKIDVHSAGRNEAQVGAFDIDQFTKLTVNIDGNVKKDHNLNISGTISGDDFPNQESMVYDSKGNGVWLGSFETSGDRQLGPVLDLPYENEENVNININVKIKVNKDGVFQGVVQTGKDGKEKLISIDDWNKQFKTDEKKQ